MEEWAGPVAVGGRMRAKENKSGAVSLPIFLTPAVER